MLRTRGVIGVSWLLACCGGRSASDADLRAAGGGNAGNAVAGAAELGGAVSAGGASTSAGGAPTLTAGAPSLGGTSAGGAPVAGSANTAGADSAGAAGIEDDGGAGPVLDYSRARWPMPNSVSSGLPHPVSFDLSSPDVAKDKVTGLVWQRTIKAYGVTMDEGANYCSQLSLAGHRDWHLPSRIELISLFAAADQSDPNTNGFPISGGFISSSLYWGIPQIPLASPSVWRVNVNNGFLGPADASVPGTAICVRLDEPRNADPAPPARLLTADMVADTGTGLFWERTPGSGWNTYDVVKAYCDGLSLGGYDDWRMPSIVEMLTISDPAQLWPAINTTDFPGDENIESGWFWSATPYRMPTTSSYAPGLNFGGLYVNSQGATFPLLVRCVR